MDKHRRIEVVLGVVLPFLFLVLLFSLYCCLRRRLVWRARGGRESSVEAGDVAGGDDEGDPEAEELIRFAGGENLTAHDILEAPGEVVGKSSYGTLYRAILTGTGSVVLLRFVRPACVGRTGDILPAVRMLGSVRHPNLVPLRAVYVGPRGEKLFVYPFYAAGTLAQFLRNGVAEAHRWEVICKLSLGIAKGLDHLHNGLPSPIVHGNLKSNNVLLDADYQPRLSDFGLHLLLNPPSGQEMLDAAAAQGYKAPDLIKMRDASTESDIYSLGVVLLEMLTQKEPKNIRLLHSEDHQHLPTSLRNLVLEHKVSNAFTADLVSHSRNQVSINEEGLVKFFELAMACCSPSPSMRPDIKHVIKRLEAIGR